MNTPRQLTSQQLDRDVSREITHIRDNHPVNPDPSNRGSKCRVCTDPEAKRRVNTMLAGLLRPAEIVENIADLNAERPKNRQITYWSVRMHRENHFNLQEPLKDAVRRTMERHAAEEGSLIAEGVGNILTARGFLAIIASKGFQDLNREDRTVDFQTGVEAQLKLESLTKDEEARAELAAIRRKVALIQQAISEEFSEDEMRRVARRLDILSGVISEDAEDTIEGVIVDDDDVDYDDDDVADFATEPDDE